MTETETEDRYDGKGSPFLLPPSLLHPFRPPLVTHSGTYKRITHGTDDLPVSVGFLRPSRVVPRPGRGGSETANDSELGQSCLPSLSTLTGPNSWFILSSSRRFVSPRPTFDVLRALTVTGPTDVDGRWDIGETTGVTRVVILPCPLGQDSSIDESRVPPLPHPLYPSTLPRLPLSPSLL